MARNIYGEASPAEQETLHDFLSKHPELQQQYILMESLIRTTNNDPHLLDNTGLLEKAAVLIAREQGTAPAMLSKKKTKSYWIYGATIAALFLIYLGVHEGGYRSRALAGRDLMQAALIAKNGNRRQAVLRDGSKVWLNGGSKLYYVTDFGGTTREVRLEGEGFFDVTKMGNKPFIVHAGALAIKVLGTAFNVKAYPDETNVTTALYRGLVSITKQEGAKNFQPILLYPNQKLVIPNRASDADDAPEALPQDAVKIETMDSTISENARLETAWMYDRLEFKGEDFVTLAKKMEHWYNVSIHFGDERVKYLSFYGSFEKETLEQAMHALQTANAFQYMISKNDVLISSSN